ncbi:LysR family transcriptional regulator [Cupriavidus basilensis]|uniref:LysR family transcriptional regulator n=1 Tax=Cupriavidus TaxID=106589 RepID=UPI00044612BF|nr:MULTISPECIES: LysR family transcriptional regulator [Cupriavidus]KDP83788.1 hypothetical protein CF70_023120 [Cupriavidus sp. SK-3]MDF3889204.1 LysR family transcriptional regulator [Cupriavidus basilensis]
MTWNLDDILWARRMKLRHLEVFLTLVESGGITAAAEAMHMTQPAVSHWLKDLEDVVGTALFIRGRQLQLTPAGEVLRRHALRMLGDVRRVNDELGTIRTGLVGRLHVGSILSAAPVILPKGIARLQRQMPGIFIHVVEATLETLLERLGRRELDLILGPLDIRAHKSGFASELLMEDTVKVVASPGHAMARKRKPTWAQAAAYDWIMPPAGTLMRTRLEDAFMHAATPVPMPRIETASIITIQMLLRESPYLTVLSGSVADHYAAMGLLECVRMAPEVAFSALGMLWNRNAESPGLSQLVQSFKEVAQSL